MSKLSFRPAGGMTGIEVTKDELLLTARRLGNKYIDEVIPVPRINITQQKERLKDCKHDGEDIYWETETGSHGWCCENCGTVIQWG